MSPTLRRIGRAAAALLLFGGPMSAQQRSVALSLDDALHMARAESPTVDIARAGVVRATGQVAQARSQYLPQIGGTAGYTRTLRSQFQGIFGSSSSSSSSSSGGIDLSKAGFGALNQWTVGASVSQNLFTGGRVSSQLAAANAQARSAGVEVTSQQAQLALTVTQAYYDAMLSDQLVSIADSALSETDNILHQTQLERQAGTAAEYDLLRAQVARDNQVPVLLQAKSNRDVAYTRLKQLLNLSLDDSVRLTTTLDAAGEPALPADASATADTAVAHRAPVRELQEAVHAQEAQVRIAKSERMPTVQAVSAFQRLWFPTSTFPAGSDLLCGPAPTCGGHENWTVGFSTSFPIFTGGRIHGDVDVAQASLLQTQAQLKQTKDAAALDTRVALYTLAQAEASWRASQGTADQAQRAYNIDEIRYHEGISTQTDLMQTRLLLQQALANRAQATRDLAVARVRLALLRDLPLQASASASAGAPSGAGQQQQQQQPSQQLTQPAGGQAAASSASTGTGRP